jgi:type IV pilus assembly protein PilA
MNRTRTQGFTLIEVLVVIAIISVLITILLPSFNAARKKPYDVAALQCGKAIVLANTTFTAEHNGTNAASLGQLNNSDVNEQCQNIQVHYFDQTGLSKASAGNGLLSAYDANKVAFLVWSQNGSNLYYFNQGYNPVISSGPW